MDSFFTIDGGILFSKALRIFFQILIEFERNFVMILLNIKNNIYNTPSETRSSFYFLVVYSDTWGPTYKISMNCHRFSPN